MASSSTEWNLASLFSTVRSLRRWMLATSLFLLSYVAVFLFSGFWIVKDDIDVSGEFDVVIALVVGAAAFIIGMVIATPAWFAMAASHEAARAYSSQSIRPLISCVKWLRRLFIVGSVLLSLFAAGLGIAIIVFIYGLTRG